MAERKSKNPFNFLDQDTRQKKAVGPKRTGPTKAVKGAMRYPVTKDQGAARAANRANNRTRKRNG